MRTLSVVVSFLMLLSLLLPVTPSAAETQPGLFEQSMSDTLDLWRGSRYDQLYEQLAHRGKTSKEQFVARMCDTSIRPACCSRKLENFKVLNEKRTTATVYAKVGLEGTPGATESTTREFKLTREENIWKMQMTDVLSIAGAAGKKKKQSSHKNSAHKKSAHSKSAHNKSARKKQAY